MTESSHRVQGVASAAAQPRLLDMMRGCMRRLGLSIRREQTYMSLVRRFILASGQKAVPRSLTVA